MKPATLISKIQKLEEEMNTLRTKVVDQKKTLKEKRSGLKTAEKNVESFDTFSSDEIDAMTEAEYENYQTKLEELTDTVTALESEIETLEEQISEKEERIEAIKECFNDMATQFDYL